MCKLWCVDTRHPLVVRGNRDVLEIQALGYVCVSIGMDACAQLGLLLVKGTSMYPYMVIQLS